MPDDLRDAAGLTDRHFDLCSRMAGCAGLDINAALRDRTLSLEAFEAMVDGCTCCREADDCATRLLRDRSDAVPDYCVNRDVFADILAG